MQSCDCMFFCFKNEKTFFLAADGSWAPIIVFSTRTSCRKGRT